jgi:ferrous iron transport protein B
MEANEKKMISVALAGNPNSGKTSLFNIMSGSQMKVGNWSGVTVEKFEGYAEYGGYRFQITDLPGIYSLEAYSPEEKIAGDFIMGKKSDVVVNVIDGTGPERSLFLTSQLMDMETPMVMAMNMYDEVIKQGIKIDLKQLQKLLGCHVIPVSAVKETGISSLFDHIIRVYEKKIDIQKNKTQYRDEIEDAIDDISLVLKTDSELLQKYPARMLALKLLKNETDVIRILQQRPIWEKLSPRVLNFIKKIEVDGMGPVGAKLTTDRHAFARGAVKETIVIPEEEKRTLTDIIDAVLINRFLGIPIFLFIMWLIFQMTFTLGQEPMRWIEYLFSGIGAWAQKALPQGMLRSVIIDGIIAGTGGVLVFVPNILLLFLGLSFLEGTGYMARAAFVVDKLFHKIGLHGKSFIPMITGFGCSVPAFMACRTLKNRGDRLATMMVIPFMSCGAKLPVYVLLIGAFLPQKSAGSALFAIYLFGILVAVGAAKLFKSTIFKGESEPFVMELPVYRMPGLRYLAIQVWIKAWMYIRKAGTTILMASILLWGLSNFPVNRNIDIQYSNNAAAIQAQNSTNFQNKQSMLKINENERLAKQLENSFAGMIGRGIEPVIRPLGFDWRIGVSLVAGLAAKEVVVSTMGTIFALGSEDKGSQALKEELRHDKQFSIPTVLSLIVFVLLYVPCLAATSVFHKEAGSNKITLFYIAFSMSSAWIISFIVYRISLFFF